ncbi:uncharacterized protein [Mytilus edulis]|uniref:uncharacterized protein n=1 Tax=Mytilus edulis TaxID=6550 RepID=UPI0039EDF504
MISIIHDSHSTNLEMNIKTVEIPSQNISNQVSNAVDKNVPIDTTPDYIISSASQSYKENSSLRALATSFSNSTASPDTTFVTCSQRRKDDFDLGGINDLTPTNGEAKEQTTSCVNDSISSPFLDHKCKNWDCHATTCYCDVNCLHLKDCCANAFRSVFGLNEITEIYDVLSDIDNFFQRSRITLSKDVHLLKDYASCYTIMLSSNQQFSLLVVDQCPQSFKGLEIIETNCILMNDSDIRKVYISQTFGDHVVYRNVFCAICHGIPMNQLTIWNAKLHCLNGVNVTSPLPNIQASCWLKFDIPKLSKEPRRCYPLLTTTAECLPEVFNRERKTIELLCSSYYDPVKYGRVSYKNSNCLPCNGANNITEDNCITDTFRTGQESLMPGFDLLFSITEKGITWNGLEIKFQCGDNMVYDIYSQVCRNLDCTKGFIPINGECVQFDLPNYFNDSLHFPCENDMLFNYVYRFEIFLVPGKQQTTEVKEIIIKWVNTHCKHLSNVISEYDFDTIAPSTINITSSVELSQILSCIKEISKNIPYINSTNIKNYENRSSLSCLENTTKLSNNFNIMSLYPGAAIAYVNKNDSIDLYYSRFEITFSQGHGQIVHLSYCTPVDDRLNCSKVTTYNTSEYTFNNNTLTVYGKAIDAKDFLIDKNDKLHLCVVKPTDSSQTTKYILEIITYVCSSISVIALIVLIIFHFALPRLLNLHGKNLVCLSMSLLTALLLYLTCRFLPSSAQIVLAVFHHMTWLSAFAWMSVISYDIARKFFIKTMMKGSGNDNRRFRLHCLFGWGIPSIIVAICSVMGFGVQGEMIDYNGNGLCWISNKTALLYALFVPVCCSFAFSFTCFSIALYGIESSRRSVIAVTKRSDNRNMCLIYTKLTVILGGTWILVFMTSNMDFLALTYISTILNGLQGLFVCMISLCNQRTFKEVRRANTKSKSGKNTSMHLTFSTI